MIKKQFILLFTVVLGCSSESPAEQVPACPDVPGKCHAAGDYCSTGGFEAYGGKCMRVPDSDDPCTLFCCAGCVVNGECMPGSSADACGFGGQECAPCVAPKTCLEGICKML